MIASYPNRAAAVADSAAVRGWISELVPESATDIREAHFLDTNEQWLRFRVPAGDTAFLARSTPLSIGDAAGPKPPVGFGQWLPDLLEPPTITRRSNLRAFRFTPHWGNPLCGALDPVTWTVYARSCGPATS
jgi:hypothetical protein